MSSSTLEMDDAGDGVEAGSSAVSSGCSSHVLSSVPPSCFTRTLGLGLGLVSMSMSVSVSVLPQRRLRRERLSAEDVTRRAGELAWVRANAGVDMSAPVRTSHEGEDKVASLPWVSASARAASSMTAPRPRLTK